MATISPLTSIDELAKLIGNPEVVDLGPVLYTNMPGCSPLRPIGLVPKG